MLEKSGERLIFVIFVSVGSLFGCQPAQTKVRFPVMYLDMDGTTLDSNHEVRPATIRALKRYKKCGGHYGIATGRTLEQVASYLDDLQPDLPLVLFNGAVVMDSQGRATLASSPIPKEALQSVLSAAKADAEVIGIVVQGPGFTIVDDDEDLDDFLSSSFVTDFRVDPEFQLKDGEVAIKMLVMVELANQEYLLEKLRQLVGGSARVIVTGPNLLEVVAPDINKALAIEEQLGKMGFSLNDAIVFGDSGNDVEMLSGAAMGIAMKNCRKEACEAALVIAGDHNSDSISAVIQGAAIAKECTE